MGEGGKKSSLFVKELIQNAMNEIKDESGIDMGDYVEYRLVTYKSPLGIIYYFIMSIMAFVLLGFLSGILLANDLALKKNSGNFIYF